MDINTIHLQGQVIAERIREHAESCQDLDCGFNPLAVEQVEEQVEEDFHYYASDWLRGTPYGPPAE